ncbi:MAG: metallophosphoesterase [Halioglobus sp.]
MKNTGRVRFLHTSDWQLGMTRAFLSDEAAPRFGQARIDAIKRLGDLAAEHGASFIAVAGDVFESNQLSRQTVLRSLNALDALPVPVFLLPGNHDPLDATSIFSSREFAGAGATVIVIRDSTPLPVPGLPHVEVVGAPWRSKHPTTDLCGALLRGLEPSSARLRIALCHGQVDTLSPDSSRPETIDLATAEAAIGDGRIHYLALGDRHSLTQVGQTGRIWYSGAPVATDFDETAPNQALLVELDGADHCEVTPLPVGQWQFIAEHRDLNSAEDLAQIARWLTGLPDKERTVVKMSFTGTINLATAARLDALFATQGELFASLRRRERITDLAIVPDELDQDNVALTGYARAAWEELLSEARSDPVAGDALRLFYRLSRSGEGA